MANAGELLFQGLSNAGSGVAQGMNNYMLMQQQDAAATGQVNAFLGQGPQAFGMLSPDGQNLLQKQIAGNASRKDRIQLLGEIQTAAAMKSQQAETGYKQAQANQLNLQNNLNQQRMNYYLNQGGGASQAAPQGTPPPGGVGQPMSQGAPAPGGPQGMPPGGAAMMQQATQPATSANLQPPSPFTIDSPQAKQMMGKAIMMTGDFDKASDLVQKQLDMMNSSRTQAYSQMVAVKKDTGRLVYQGPQYENGQPSLDTYRNEIVTAPGTASQGYDTGDKVISYKHGVRPPQSVVFRPGQNLPDISQANGSGNADAVQATIDAASPVNQTDPGWQKAQVDARASEAGDASTLAQSDLFLNAAQAYGQGGQSQYNALRGDPRYAALASMFTGKNALGSLRTAMAANTHSILAQVQNNQGNTIGGRMLETEFNNTQEMLGHATMDNPTILSAAMNLRILTQRKFDIDHAFAEYRQAGMTDADAENMAVKQYGKSPPLIPSGHARMLIAGQNDPAVRAQFDAKYGAGLSQYAQGVLP